VNTDALAIGDDVVAIEQLEPVVRKRPGEHIAAVGQTRTTIVDLLEQRTLERNSLAEVLNHLAVSIIMVDPKQRIVHTNAAAEELLTEGRILSSVRGILTANDARDHEGLRRMTRAPDPNAKSLSLQPDKGHVTVATVLPLGRGLRATYGKRHWACAAIFVHGQPLVDDGLVTTLAAAFGLTRTEARVLSALLQGLSLPDIATRHQISINTVRWHLKQLFEKTNCNRQSDLIRVAASAIPPIRGAPRGKPRGNRP
jgi:DNA-binding CsgD family transcriptional regulator/PAS domain-containing protein